MSVRYQWASAREMKPEAADNGEEFGEYQVDSPMAITMDAGGDGLIVEGTHQELIALGADIVRAAAAHLVATKRAEHENALHHEPSEDDRRWCPECTPELVCEHPEEVESEAFHTYCKRCFAIYDEGWQAQSIVAVTVAEVAGN